jgi:hypothetical protein
MYKAIYTLTALQEYTSDAAYFAFDFETAPDAKYRKEERTALDAHKSHIVGISFSVVEGDGVYLPLAHRIGQNAADPEAVWSWLAASSPTPPLPKSPTISPSKVNSYTSVASWCKNPATIPSPPRN